MDENKTSKERKNSTNTITFQSAVEKYYGRYLIKAALKKVLGK